MRDRRNRAETLIRIQQGKSPYLFLGGLDVESEGSGTLVVRNPTDGGPLGRIPTANARDVDKAVESGRRLYFDHWQPSPPSERARLLWRFSDALENEAEDLAILESLQTGKTFRDVLTYDVEPSIRALRYFAGWVDKLGGERLELGPSYSGTVSWEGPAVLGAVLPLHDPLAAAVRHCGAALALGSALVLKAPEQAPLSVLQWAAIMHQHGLPPGAINVLTGQATTEEAMAAHPGISALTYAGSVDQARRMLVGAAKSNLKPVHFELGGKSVAVVFEDAPAARAAYAVCGSIFRSRCTHGAAAALLYVHESLYTDVCNAVTSRARETVLGDPLDEHTELGPMTDEAHLKRVLAYVELGRREGGKVVAGGNRDVEGNRARGCFVKPSVLVDVRDEWRVTREDINGPVLCVAPFRREEEVIDRVNGSDYGLAASVWSNQLARAHRVGRRLDVGTVWINTHDVSEPSLPWAGRRLSGRATTMGRAMLTQLAQPKSVLTDTR